MTCNADTKETYFIYQDDNNHYTGGQLESLNITVNNTITGTDVKRSVAFDKSYTFEKLFKTIDYGDGGVIRLVLSDKTVEAYVLNNIHETFTEANAANCINNKLN